MAHGWWKRRLWKLPVWAWIAVVVVIVGAAAAGGNPPANTNDRSAGDPATAPSPTVAVATTTAAVATDPATTAAPVTAPPITATTSGLTANMAQAACNAYGQQAFPYGWDPHWIIGRLAEEIIDDRWFLKVEADLTNQYNAERSFDVECFVGGTNEAPIVEQFNAY